MQTLISTAAKISIYVLLLALFVNCSKNPVKCLNGSWVEDVASDLEVVTTASTNYSNNPSLDNCNSYVGALNNYINALEDIEDCYGGLADFDGDFNDAKQDLSEIDCESL